jgi:malonate transporter MadL subunit
MIYGLGILALSFILGQWVGELLGSVLGIDANVGGVGFAMIFLMLLKEWFSRKGWFNVEMESGIEFWNKLYIPIVIAMAASLNVQSAVSSGTLALMAGILPVFLAFAIFPRIVKSFKPD